MLSMRIDKLLEKDVKKDKLSSEEAQRIKDRVTTLGGIEELRESGKDVQLVMEVSYAIPLSRHSYARLCRSLAN